MAEYTLDEFEELLASPGTVNPPSSTKPETPIKLNDGPVLDTISGLVGALDRGVRSANQAMLTSLAAGQRIREKTVESKNPLINNPFSRYFVWSSTGGGGGDILRSYLGENAVPALMGQVAEIEKAKQEKTYFSEGQKEFRRLAEAGRPWAGWKKNPIEITASIALESLPASIAGSIVGGLTAGPPGLIAGTAAGSFAQTLSGELMGYAAEAGYDPTDVESYANFAESDAFDKSFNKALIKSAAVAGIDAVTAGRAGVFMKPALGRGFRKTISASGKELGLQMAGGSAGEALGQFLAGQDMSSFDIFMEAFAEAATVAPEVYTNIRSDIKKQRYNSAREQADKAFSKMWTDLEDYPDRQRFFVDLAARNGKPLSQDEVERYGLQDELRKSRYFKFDKDLDAWTPTETGRIHAQGLYDRAKREYEQLRRSQSKEVGTFFSKAMDQLNEERAASPEDVAAYREVQRTTEALKAEAKRARRLAKKNRLYEALPATRRPELESLSQTARTTRKQDAALQVVQERQAEQQLAERQGLVDQAREVISRLDALIDARDERGRKALPHRAFQRDQRHKLRMALIATENPNPNVQERGHAALKQLLTEVNQLGQGPTAAPEAVPAEPPTQPAPPTPAPAPQPEPETQGIISTPQGAQLAGFQPPTEAEKAARAEQLRAETESARAQEERRQREFDASPEGRWRQAAAVERTSKEAMDQIRNILPKRKDGQINWQTKEKRSLVAQYREMVEKRDNARRRMQEIERENPDVAERIKQASLEAARIDVRPEQRAQPSPETPAPALFQRNREQVQQANIQKQEGESLVTAELKADSPNAAAIRRGLVLIGESYIEKGRHKFADFAVHVQEKFPEQWSQLAEHVHPAWKEIARLPNDPTNGYRPSGNEIASVLKRLGEYSKSEQKPTQAAKKALIKLTLPKASTREREFDYWASKWVAEKNAKGRKGALNKLYGIMPQLKLADISNVNDEVLVRRIFNELNQLVQSYKGKKKTPKGQAWLASAKGSVGSSLARAIRQTVEKAAGSSQLSDVLGGVNIPAWTTLKGSGIWEKPPKQKAPIPQPSKQSQFYERLLEIHPEYGIAAMVQFATGVRANEIMVIDRSERGQPKNMDGLRWRDVMFTGDPLNDYVLLRHRTKDPRETMTTGQRNRVVGHLGLQKLLAWLYDYRTQQDGTAPSEDDFVLRVNNDTGKPMTKDGSPVSVDLAYNPAIKQALNDVGYFQDEPETTRDAVTSEKFRNWFATYWVQIRSQLVRSPAGSDPDAHARQAARIMGHVDAPTTQITLKENYLETPAWLDTWLLRQQEGAVGQLPDIMMNLPVYDPAFDAMWERAQKKTDSAEESRKIAPVPDSKLQKDRYVDPNDWTKNVTQETSEQGLTGYVTRINPKKVELSKDVENFKAESDKVTGITEELKGPWRETQTSTIVVWERRNGDLEIITGRHRWDLAKRENITTIPAVVFREKEGWDATRGRILDAEDNMRGGKGSTRDYADYFRNNRDDVAYTEQEAEDRGLFQSAAARHGWAIGTFADDPTYEAWINRQINDSQAGAISYIARDNSSVQTVLLRKTLSEKKKKRTLTYDDIVGMGKGLLLEAAGIDPSERLGQGDMFSDDPEASAMLDIWAERERMAQEEIKTLKSKAGVLTKYKSLSKIDPKTAKELSEVASINIRNPDQLRDMLAEIQKGIEEWARWQTNPDLINKIKLRQLGDKGQADELSRDLFSGGNLTEEESKRYLTLKKKSNNVEQGSEEHRKLLSEMERLAEKSGAQLSMFHVGEESGEAAANRANQLRDQAKQMDRLGNQLQQQFYAAQYDGTHPDLRDRWAREAREYFNSANQLRRQAQEFDDRSKRKGQKAQKEQLGLELSRYQYPQEIEDAFNSAELIFGLTDNLSEAGYVLPDGRMLDFTGRHEASKYILDDNLKWVPKRGERDYLAGQRVIDHRNIDWAGKDLVVDFSESANAAMDRFMSYGAIRTHYSNGQANLDIPSKPTPAQMAVLRRFVEESNGDVSFDVADGNRKQGQIWNEGTKWNRIKGQLLRFYGGVDIPGGSQLSVIHDSQRPDSSLRDRLLFAANQLHSTTDLKMVVNDPASELSDDMRNLLNGLLDSGMADRFPALMWSIVDEIDQFGSQGSYSDGLIKFTTWSSSETPVHEFFHHVYRYLRPEDKKYVNDLRRKTASRHVNQLRGRMKTVPAFLDYLVDGTLTSEESITAGVTSPFYHLSNPSEFFTWMMTNRAQTEFAGKHHPTWVSEIRSVLRRLWNRLKEIFGFTEYDNVLWEQLLTGRYEYDPNEAARFSNKPVNLSRVEEFNAKLKYASNEIGRSAAETVRSHEQAANNLQSLAYEKKLFNRATRMLNELQNAMLQAWQETRPDQPFPSYRSENRGLFSWVFNENSEYGDIRRALRRTLYNYGDLPSDRTVLYWVEAVNTELKGVEYANLQRRISQINQWISQAKEIGLNEQYVNDLKDVASKLERASERIEKMDEILEGSYQEGETPLGTPAARGREILQDRNDQIDWKVSAKTLSFPEVKESFLDPIQESKSLVEEFGEAMQGMVESLKDPSLGAMRSSITNEFVKKWWGVADAALRLKERSNSRKPELLKQIKDSEKGMSAALMAVGEAEVLLSDAQMVMTSTERLSGSIADLRWINDTAAFRTATVEFVQRLVSLRGMGYAMDVIQRMADPDSRTRLSRMDQLIGLPEGQRIVTQEAWDNILKALTSSPTYKDAVEAVVTANLSQLNRMPAVRLGRIYDLLNEGTPEAREQAQEMVWQLKQDAKSMVGAAGARFASEVRAIESALVEIRAYDMANEMFDAVFASPELFKLRRIAEGEIPSDENENLGHHGIGLTKRMIMSNGFSRDPDAASTTFMNFGTEALEKQGAAVLEPLIISASSDFVFAGDNQKKMLDWFQRAQTYMEMYEEALQEHDIAKRELAIAEQSNDAAKIEKAKVELASKLKYFTDNFEMAAYKGLSDAMEYQHSALDPTVSQWNTKLSTSAFEIQLQKWSFFRQFLGAGRMTDGLTGRALEKAIVGYGNSAATARAIMHKYGEKLKSARSAAMNSHKGPDGKPIFGGNIWLYRKEVFNEMGSEGRKMGAQFSPGMKLPTYGHTVTKEDIALFTVIEDLYREARERLTEIGGRGVLMEREGTGEVYVRKAASVGGRGLPMYLSTEGRDFVENLVRAAREQEKLKLDLVDFTADSLHPIVRFWNDPTRINHLVRHILDAGREYRDIRQEDWMRSAEQSLANEIQSRGGALYLKRDGTGNLDMEDIIRGLVRHFPQDTGSDPRTFIEQALMRELDQYVRHATSETGSEADYDTDTVSIKIGVSRGSEFTKPAAHFLFPSTLYDYGSITNGELVHLGNRMIHEPVVELVTSLQRAKRAMLAEMDRNRDPRHFQTNSRMGVVVSILSKLENDIEKLYGAASGDVRSADGVFVGDLVKSSLLANPTVGIRNVVLGQVEFSMRAIALNRTANALGLIQTLVNVPKIAGKFLTHVIWSPYYRARKEDSASWISRELNKPYNQNIILQGVEWLFQKIAIDHFNAVEHMQDMGFSLRTPLRERIANDFRSAREFQSNWEADNYMRGGLGGSVSRVWRHMRTLLRAPIHFYRKVGTEFFDLLINAQSLNFIGGLEENLKEVAMKWGDIQAERMRNGEVGSFDPTDPKWVMPPEVFSNRIGAAQKRKNLGEWRKFLRGADVSLEVLLWDYYERAKNNREMNLNIFDPDQLRRVQAAFLRETNAGDAINRPVEFATSKVMRNLFIFQGYSSDFLVKLAAIGNNTKDKKWVDMFTASLPAIMMMIVAGAVYGLGAQAGTERWRRKIQGLGARQIDLFDKEFYTWSNFSSASFGAMMSAFPLVGDLMLFARGLAINNRGYEPSQRLLAISMLGSFFQTFKGSVSMFAHGQPKNALLPWRDFVISYGGGLREVFGTAAGDWAQGRKYGGSIAAVGRQADVLGISNPKSQFQRNMGKFYSPTTGIRENLVGAMMRNDKEDLRKAYQDLVSYYRSKGTDNVYGAVRRDINAMHPYVKGMGGKKPTVGEFRRIWERLSPSQKELVRQAVAGWRTLARLAGSDYSPFASGGGSGAGRAIGSGLRRNAAFGPSSGFGSNSLGRVGFGMIGSRNRVGFGMI